MDGSSITLRLSGSPGVFAADGTPLDLPVGKPFALLVYLHLHGAPASRDTLGNLLWPDASRDRARGSLRQALWALRRALGEDLLLGDDPIQLASGRVNSDLQELRLRLREGDMEGARAVWAGLPLQELRIADASPWTRWSEELAQELEDRYVTGLMERGRRARGQGSAADAVPWFQEALTLQPSPLRHFIELAETFLDLRRFDAAAETLQEARQLAESSDEIRQLEELERRLQTVRKGQAGGSRAGDPPHLAFVGRSQEFATLLQVWRQAQTGRFRVALVTGEPGIGKTRLSHELGLLIGAEGGRVLTLKGEDSEHPIELGLVGELVDRLLKLSGAAGISPASDAILRTLLPSQASSDVTESGARPGRRSWIRLSASLTDALSDLIQAVAEDGPLLLIVDDLHWADPESRSVLTRLASQLKAPPVFLLLTCRTDFPDPGVRKTLSLLTEGRALRIEVSSWSLKELTELLGSVISFPSPTQGIQVIARIHAASRGNPLFVLELLKVLKEEGYLEPGSEGRWMLRPGSRPADLPLPSNLGGLVDRQLSQLSDAATMVAAHLAQIGYSASARTLALRAGVQSAVVPQGIGELLERRLVRWEEGDRLGFTHDEIRTAVSRRFQLQADAIGRHAWWPPSPAWLTGLTALALFVGVAQWLEPPARPALLPFGSGQIFFQAGDTLLGFELRNPTSDGLHPLDEVRLESPDPDLLDEADTPAGRWEIHRSENPLDQATFDLVVSLQPRGTDPDGVSERRLLSFQTEVRLGVFSPSLRWIAAAVSGPADSLFVLDLEGERAAAVETPPLLGGAWCGEETLAILVQGPESAELVIWSPFTGSWTPVPIREVIPGGAVACSPDGSTLLLHGVRNGTLGVFLHLIGGQILPLNLPAGLQPHRIRWVLPPEARGPGALSIVGGRSLVLPWGEALDLDADLPGLSRERAATELRWSTSHPDRLQVDRAGRVIARGEGSAWVHADWKGWLRDSIQIEATGSTHPNVRFLDLEPHFEVDPSDGRRRVYTGLPIGSFSSGGLLEGELRLRRPLEVGDQASLCLVADARSESGTSPVLCLTFPGEIGPRGNPAEALLRTHHPFPPRPHPVLGALERGGVRFGLRLLSDGTAEVLINGEKRAPPWPIRFDVEGEMGWRIQLEERSARAGDSAVDWGEITVWSGPGPYP
jgi:DNA-binding SARP family transcriptional activator